MASRSSANSAGPRTFIQDYHRYTFSLQNPDGSFSTEWFERRGNDPDIDRRLKTSGHILEWIGFSLSDDELRDPRMIKAVDYVATILAKNDQHTWEIGPLGHGLHALAIYDDRVFKDVEPMQPSPHGRRIDRREAAATPPEARTRRHRQSRGPPSTPLDSARRPIRRCRCRRADSSHVGQISLRLTRCCRRRRYRLAVAPAGEKSYDCVAAGCRRLRGAVVSSRRSHATPRSDVAVKTFRFTDQFETIFDAAAQLSQAVDADAMLLLLEGPTDWERLKARSPARKILVAADFRRAARRGRRRPAWPPSCSKCPTPRSTKS